jgi:hypothetical protein
MRLVWIVSRSCPARHRGAHPYACDPAAAGKLCRPAPRASSVPLPLAGPFRLHRAVLHSAGLKRAFGARTRCPSPGVSAALACRGLAAARPHLALCSMLAASPLQVAVPGGLAASGCEARRPQWRLAATPASAILALPRAMIVEMFACRVRRSSVSSMSSTPTRSANRRSKN